MSTQTPEHCRPEAYELFAAQVERIETSDALLRAAVAVAMHAPGDEWPNPDADAVDESIEQIAASVFDRLNQREPHAILAHTHAVLFDEMRFAGDTEDYYNPINSYLPAVLARRRGIPVTLSLVYKAVLERLGLAVVGINAPAHFLVAVDVDAAPMYVDAFHGGRTLTADEAVHRIESLLGESTTHTKEELMPEATHAQWLTRLLKNLVHVFGAADRPHDAAAMLELARLLRTDTPEAGGR